MCDAEESEASATSVETAFGAYRAQYPARPANLAVVLHESELRLLTSAEGVSEFSMAPAQGPLVGTPPSEQSVEGTNRHLWVVREANLPYILEEPKPGVNLPRICHTNLTGGAETQS